MSLTIKWGDVSGLNRFDNMLKALGDKRMTLAQVRAMKRVGDMAKTAVIRTLTKQTGLKRKVIVKAIGKPKLPSFGDVSYVMKTEGGDIGLKYFSAREVRAGVSAAPLGKRRVFAGDFMRGGQWPNRVSVPGFNGHVFARAGSGRLPIAKQKSGVFIPKEMVTGATAQVFEKTVATNLPKRVEHEISRLSGGVLT